jgi:dTDP-glucose 4,6-dehydratase
MVAHALAGKPLPVYGQGAQVREWLHVDDHTDGLWLALTEGTPGESYNFGSGEESDNLRMVERLADTVDAITGKPQGTSRALITFVTDRKGHDFRYAIDSQKAKAAFGWQAKRTLASDLRGVVEWYRDNAEWCRHVSSEEHARFQAAYYKQSEGPKK